MTSLTDRIREHVVARLASLATARGPLVAICSGDVVRSMGLVNRTPAVCGALRGAEFQRMADLEFVERCGPAQSTTTTFLYKPIRVGRSAPTDANDGGVSVVPTQPQVHKRTAHMPRVSSPRKGLTALPDADLCLVSCVKEKLSTSAPAKDLYTSQLFRKMRRLVEAQGWPWLILSARYGVVEPERVIASYEHTLNTMRVAERRDWAARCLHALEPHLADVKSLIVLAGARYSEFLVPALSDRGIKVHEPMARLPFGKRLAWLNRVTP